MPAECALSNAWIGLGVVFALFIIFYGAGYPANRMSVFKSFAPTLVDKKEIDHIHGWGTDCEETGYFFFFGFFFFPFLSQDSFSRIN